MTAQTRGSTPVNRETEVALANSARALVAEGKLPEAEATWRAELAIERQLSGNEHLFVANSLTSLGHVLLDEKKFPEAEAAYREALDIQRKKLPTTNPTISNTLVSLGFVLCKQGKAQEAEPLLREGLRIREGESPPSKPAIANVRTHLGNALMIQRRYAEAEPVILAACEELKDAPPTWQAHRSSAYQRAVELYDRWGKRPLAEEWRVKRAALQPTRTAAPSTNRATTGAAVVDSVAVPPGPLSATSLAQLNVQAYTLRRDGRPEDARALRRRVVEEARKLLPRSPQLALYQNNYVELLLELQEFDEAEKVALDALDTVVGGDKAQRERALRLLVQLCADWGKPEKVDRYENLLSSLDATTKPATQPSTKPSTQPTTSPTTMPSGGSERRRVRTVLDFRNLSSCFPKEEMRRRRGRPAICRSRCPIILALTIKTDVTSALLSAL